MLVGPHLLIPGGKHAPRGPIGRYPRIVGVKDSVRVWRWWGAQKRPGLDAIDFIDLESQIDSIECYFMASVILINEEQLRWCEQDGWHLWLQAGGQPYGGG
jgi:hypothetical protein